MEISKQDYEQYKEAVKNCKKGDLTSISNSSGLELKKVLEISRNIETYRQEWGE